MSKQSNTSEVLGRMFEIIREHPQAIKYYHGDFYHHDYQTIMTATEGQEFIWHIRECGTWLWNCGMKSGDMNDYLNHTKQNWSPDRALFHVTIGKVYKGDSPYLKAGRVKEVTIEEASELARHYRKKIESQKRAEKEATRT